MATVDSGPRENLLDVILARVAKLNKVTRSAYREPTVLCFVHSLHFGS
jgi:hypothetical protein